ncbi:MAG TPA: DUF1508 domain-containing protein [Thermoanaerobaculia bacterium]|nr:DUF1508 domain-containing protein [Thermoanaerobaculia bacterium]
MVQQPALYKPILIRVDIAGLTRFVETVDDPRDTRGVYRPQLGHSHGRAASGTLYASIPFDSPGEILNAQVLIADVSEAVKRVHDPEALAAMLDDSEAPVQAMGIVAAPQLTTHRDWDRVADVLGLPRQVNRYEIYRDREGRIRWRLRRANGEIVAESAESYADRKACEEDLRWIRANAATASIVALDISVAE